MKNKINIIDLGSRLVVIGILAYSAFLKLSSNPSAVHIFERINMEPIGRYAVAVLEVIAVILLAFHKTAWRGATLALVLMLGAIGMHIITNEFDVLGDKGLMFASAVVVLFCSIGVLINQADMEAQYAED
ncbi:MAG: hypothetical protein RJA25_409 [Bacteroidota bacterium]|jgi:uncharacterized membrane protein YphA (DoxX/SURF4 family)